RACSKTRDGVCFARCDCGEQPGGGRFGKAGCGFVALEEGFDLPSQIRIARGSPSDKGAPVRIRILEGFEKQSFDTIPPLGLITACLSQGTAAVVGSLGSVNEWHAEPSIRVPIVTSNPKRVPRTSSWPAAARDYALMNEGSIPTTAISVATSFWFRRRRQCDQLFDKPCCLRVRCWRRARPTRSTVPRAQV